jgi:hypothetical protein
MCANLTIALYTPPVGDGGDGGGTPARHHVPSLTLGVARFLQ